MRLLQYTHLPICPFACMYKIARIHDKKMRENVYIFLLCEKQKMGFNTAFFIHFEAAL